MTFGPDNPSRGLVSAIGVYDLISAKLAETVGAKAAYVTGYGVTASHLGLPDAGLATFTDMVGRIAQICDAISIPVIADADTGYGGLLNVRHTVRGYEKAGVAAIQIEDQEFPKKCGHTPMRRVIPAGEMVDKIRVACDSRHSSSLLVIARTDARSGLGLDEALTRGELYAEAGADIVFVESPESEAELVTIGDRFRGRALANMVHGGRTPIMSPSRLEEVGFRVAIYPSLGFLAAGHALRAAYSALVNDRPVDVPLHDFQQFHSLMGFEDVWAFEKKYANHLGDDA